MGYSPRAISTKVKSEYPCPHPGWEKILATTFSLRRHVDLKHRKQKNHVWKYWGKRFSLLQYLKEHVLIHTQETPFVCNINGCQAAFRQRAKLCAHRKTHKTDQNQEESADTSNAYNLFNRRFTNEEMHYWPNYCPYLPESSLPSVEVPFRTLPPVNFIPGLFINLNPDVFKFDFSEYCGMKNNGNHNTLNQISQFMN